ncbi:hypothetical protein FBU59_000499 [Linderina macrospora]|uniref:Uncharacterized protein n=1 Tax=Linderina macrospora TaxID=4868 RepID=A0ACC1JH03_9FUNG|nr:hypothetical protein FBU59_000499 [Linderina macrospora]
MIGQMLRRSRDASSHNDSHFEIASSASGESPLEVLSSAAGTINNVARQAMADDQQMRKRARARLPSSHSDMFDDSVAGDQHGYTNGGTPPPTKRRGRPPRDYGDELGQAFAMFAADYFNECERTVLATQGSVDVTTRQGKTNVLRAVWDKWWSTSQMIKDRYLTRSQHEMISNEVGMLELMIQYPLPPEVEHTQRQSSPDPITPLEMFIREQRPLLREKVPDWSDAEIRRRLEVNWNNMSDGERSKYAIPGATVTPLGQHSASMSAMQGMVSSGSPIKGVRLQSAPRRAYVMFCRQERPLVVGANQDWDLPAVNKELGRKWKELTPDQRQVFFDMERREAEQRGTNTLTPTYVTHSPTQSHMPMPPMQAGRIPGTGTFTVRNNGRAPTPGHTNPNKGPSKAYVCYSRVTRKAIVAKHPEWDLAAVNRELGRLWKLMSTDDRMQWENYDPEGPKPEIPPITPQRSAPVAKAPTIPPSRIPIAPRIAVPPVAPVVAAAPQPQQQSQPQQSLPVTPASGTATPASNADAAARHHDYEGEGEVEDVDLQDDEETEDEGVHNHHEQTNGQTPAAIALPQKTAASGPPPTAKPAVVASPESAVSVSSINGGYTPKPNTSM